MSRRAAPPTLSYMVDDSASEDEFAQTSTANMLTSDSLIENAAPAMRRSVGRPRAAANTKSAAAKTQRTTRRTSGGSVAGTAKVAKKAPPKRKALAERPEPNASDTEEVEDFDPIEEPEELAPPAKLKGRGRAKQAHESPIAPEPAKKSKPAAKGRGRQTKKEPSPEPMTMVIPETQANLDLMDIEPSIEDIPELPETQPLPKQIHRARSVSKQRAPGLYKRAGSASDTERPGNDPALRRKLGDLTKRFENLDVKYHNLRDVGMRDAETNFEKLQRSTDERAKAQDDLIASMKKELATQRALAAESKSLKSQIAELNSTNKKLSSENRSLETQLSDSQSETKAMHAQLSESQAEIKTLTTKLAATRANSSNPEHRVPGSAVKSQRTAMPGGAEAAKDSQVRQLKEDLYSDLTGLIIRGVRRGEDEDVYDCIQTGRNGTLHFHLSVASDDKPSGQSYEEAEFAYTPLLDESRDRDLLDILPDYLTEEICFPRSSAAKFYAKVVDCMTKKVIIEE
ncbi:putative chromosome segregation protein [Neofusicoccum parvum UCRNP2]|uniref:Chromosome segregation protein n=2 Tax=Neofusicoccum parvum TaxID=310453 RepID=A0ACB5SIP3_9PEZI|nr:putative chromosome segregation protein [Neofusicoccum parvum UCRNP2]GME42696.1 chromosome segregation protein [Neofusicoccum parvum]